ncbi:synaptogenesis protein syg-2-like [Tachypleus tridentatus]|uniref:synaptogenesis protein syg-2-like n=1 Tax=Tachypleus tridentatus TaxID=6853 RepID=UPI003FD4EB9A
MVKVIKTEKTNISYILLMSLTFCCLLCTALTENRLTSISEKIPRTEIYTLVGHPAQLPCDISPEFTSDKVSLVLWYNNKSPSPVYSLDARRGSLSYSRHWRSDELASRAYFNIKDVPAHLTLDPVTEGDEGVFTCRVDFHKARTRYWEVGLNLVVLPSKPVIRDETGHSQQSLIGPYNEGDILTLICEVAGGKPQPNVTWWRESVLLDNFIEVKTFSTVKNILKIPFLQRHDLMAAFICEASNTDLILPLSTSVTVDLNFRPLEVHLVAEGLRLSSGKRAEIECYTAGSRPPAIISWWKGNVRLLTAKSMVSVNGNITTSILTFTPGLKDNGIYLSCAAENRLVPGSDMEDGIKLDIHYAPQVFLRLGSKLRHSHIQEGNDVYFECNIHANPSASHIGWKFEGQEIYTNTASGIIVSNQTLVLQNVQLSSRGHYICVATNIEGRKESNSVFLRVQYAPVCAPQHTCVYRAGLNYPVEVTCELKSDPTDVIFSWSFNNSYHNHEVLTFVSKGTVSTVRYTPKSEYEFGTLLCAGSNSVGEQQNPCSFSIIPAEIPEPVSNCSFVKQTDNEVGIECTEGYDGGQKQKFYVEVQESLSSRLILNISFLRPVFSIQNLPSGSSFNFKIYSFNMQGTSDPVLYKGFTLQPFGSHSDQGKKWAIPINALLTALMSIFVVLIFIAVCAVFILKLRLITRDDRETRETKVSSSNYDWKDTMATEDNSKDSLEEICPDIIPDVKYLEVPFRSLQKNLNSSKSSREEVMKDIFVSTSLKGETNKTFQNYVQETVT